MIKDMLFGDSYNPLIVRAYQGDILIFERSSPATWDYEVENKIFDGTTGCVINTGLTPFDETHKNRGFRFEMSTTVNSTVIPSGSTASDFPFARKIYVSCNTSATNNDNKPLYWTGGSGDNLSHTQLRMIDPSFGLGSSSSSNNYTFRIRGTEHLSDRIDAIGTITGTDDGTYQNIVEVEWDRSTHKMSLSSYRLDANGEIIQGSPATGSGYEVYGDSSTSQILATSNNPILLGGCYDSSYIYDPDGGNTAWRIMGTDTRPVTLNYFRFKYL